MDLYRNGQTFLSMHREWRGPSHLTFWNVDDQAPTNRLAFPPDASLDIADEMMIVAYPREESARIDLGRVSSRAIECSIQVTPTGSTITGDSTLLDSLPERVNISPGTLVERGDRQLRLRCFPLDHHLDDGTLPEMPAFWVLTPDRQHAIAYRSKGSAFWPVIELASGRVVNQIQSIDHQAPSFALGPRDIYVSVLDQIHVLDSIHGQLSAGVRLRNDNSGNSIGDMQCIDNGKSLLISWLGRQRPQGRKEVVASLEQIAADVATDPVRFVRVAGWNKEGGLGPPL